MEIDSVGPWRVEIFDVVSQVYQDPAAAGVLEDDLVDRRRNGRARAELRRCAADTATAGVARIVEGPHRIAGADVVGEIEPEILE